MKKVLSWIAASAGMMLVLPWMAVTFVKGDGGMAICFVLFFALNPIYAICVGCRKGREKTVGAARDHSAALFDRHVVVFRLGREGFFPLCAYLFVPGDCGDADFDVHKKEEKIGCFPL